MRKEAGEVNVYLTPRDVSSILVTTTTVAVACYMMSGRKEVADNAVPTKLTSYILYQVKPKVLCLTLYTTIILK